jgi:Telomere capping, CST complex subunit
VVHDRKKDNDGGHCRKSITCAVPRQLTTPPSRIPVVERARVKLTSTHISNACQHLFSTLEGYGKSRTSSEQSRSVVVDTSYRNRGESALSRLVGDLHCPQNKADSSNSVTNYSVSSGILTLRHDHPIGEAKKQLTIVNVDIGLLLQSLKSTDTQVGEWVNVIGYVTAPSASSLISDAKAVQALILWSANSIHIKEYEEAMEERISLHQGAGNTA